MPPNPPCTIRSLRTCLAVLKPFSATFLPCLLCSRTIHLNGAEMSGASHEVIRAHLPRTREDGDNRGKGQTPRYLQILMLLDSPKLQPNNPSTTETGLPITASTPHAPWFPNLALLLHFCYLRSRSLALCTKIFRLPTVWWLWWCS